jgi:hypothetical protein
MQYAAPDVLLYRPAGHTTEVYVADPGGQYLPGSATQAVVQAAEDRPKEVPAVPAGKQRQGGGTGPHSAAVVLWSRNGCWQQQPLESRP